MRAIKKRISILLAITILILATFESNASDEEAVLIKGHATSYCLKGTTASGQTVRKGICANGHKEWLGKTIVIYQRLPDGRVGEMIGVYECLDTGCGKSVIDVWCPDMLICQVFMNRVYEDGCQGRVYIQVIEAEG